ncbi:MAG: hypothetical protein GY906_21290 [bacterium]|nr:hypothetical protein [bacterium]
MIPQSKVLFTGMAADEVERYADALVNHDIEVESVSDPRVACERIGEEQFDTVVSAYPLASGDIGRIVSALRSPPHRDNNCGLVLLTAPASLRAASGLVGRGVSKALSVEEDPNVVGMIVQRIAQASRESLERLPINVEVECRFDRDLDIWKTENISSGGMLVATENSPPEGSRFRFSLQLGDEPICGQAKVVRRVTMKREPAEGFGARFLSFNNNDKSRLMAHLEEARARERVTE